VGAGPKFVARWLPFLVGMVSFRPLDFLGEVAEAVRYCLELSEDVFKEIGDFPEYVHAVQQMSGLMRYPPWCTSTSFPLALRDMSSVSHPFRVTPLLLRIGTTISSQTFIEKKSSHP